MSDDSDNETTRPRILPPVYLLAAIALMIGMHEVVSAVLIVPAPYRFIGKPIIFMGLGIIVWGWAVFRRAGTTIKPFEESSQLVAGGPFKFSRNPIYIGMVVVLFGVGVTLGSALPFVVLPLFAWVIQRRVIEREEEMLAATFGEQYDEYCRKVRRWI